MTAPADRWEGWLDCPRCHGARFTVQADADRVDITCMRCRAYLAAALVSAVRFTPAA